MKNRNENYKRPNKVSERRKTGSLIKDQKPTLTNEDKLTNKSFFLFRFIRGLFFLFLLLVCIIFISSIFLRQEVRSLLNQKKLASSSVVLTRPFAIELGRSLKDTNLLSRLNRLNYREVSSRPSKEGEYQISSDGISIYIRQSFINPDTDQKAGLYKISLTSSNQISNLTDLIYNTNINNLWLESEVLSVLGNSSEKASQSKKLNEFSHFLKDAVMAIEDEHFYYHFGINPIAVIRASITNFKAGKVIQGGSTITQQLAKNLFFSPERSILRKAKEAIAALLIEMGYSKNQIFEMYLNEIFLGQEGRFAIHGFGEASDTFFGKDVSDITLAEAAMLAGIIKAPTNYSPRRNFERCKERQKVVLDRMFELGEINKDQYEKAITEKITILDASRTRRIAPYFVDYLQREITTLINKSGEIKDSLRIMTGLDLEYQICAENAVANGLKNIEKSHPWIRKVKEPLQASLISVIPSSGEVRAWVGGRDFSDSQFDRISLASRQPGSTFKPFVYLTALDGSLNQYRTARTTSILVDEPISINIPGGTWNPKNYDEEYRGEVTLREALSKSLNIPTIQIAQKVGIKNVAKTGELFGFGKGLPEVPSLALGAGEVSSLELAKAYSILANGGIRRNLKPYLHVLDASSTDLVSQKNIFEERIASEGPVYVLIDILRSAVNNGTGQVIRRMGVTGDIAGKTGTTNDGRDSWFVGFSPRILAVVWVGFDSNRALKLTGAEAAAPIWAAYYNCISNYEPDLEFLQPESVISKQIDSSSRLIATKQCPHELIKSEIFVNGTEPLTDCPIHSNSSKTTSDPNIPE